MAIELKSRLAGTTNPGAILRHFKMYKALEMILENMDSKFDLVLEGQESLRKEMHGIRDDLSEKIDQNTFLINALNQKIHGVDEKLSKKIDGVEEKLSKKIDGVEEKLSKRIDGVEENLSKKIDGVASDLKAHRVDTEAHRGVYGVRED
jgi:hypothetical protein